MKVKLNTPERMTLSSLLPEKGTFLNLKLVRETQESLSFTEEEHARLKFINLPDGRIKWNHPANPEDDYREFEFSDLIVEMIRKELKKLDESADVELRHVSIYEKFMG
jgi:hypothetical protein